jgi:hypothetical protein
LLEDILMGEKASTRPNRASVTSRLAAITVSVLASAAVARLASAGLVPGGGQPESDCYAELLVLDVDTPGPLVTNDRVVSCTDGDECDGDGQCGNDSCDFSVAVCVSQADPDLPACTPATVRRLSGRARRLGVPGRDFKPDRLPHSSLFQSTFPVEPRSGASCGRLGGMTVSVGTTRNGRTLAGKLELSLIATAEGGTRPAQDRDRIVLQCLPRTTGCPEP